MGLYPLNSPVEVAIATWEWGSYLGDEGKRNGVRAARVLAGGASPPTRVIPAAKASGQYLNSILAKIEADKAGYEEGILLDQRGMVCEGTGENLFIVKDGVIATPGYTADILGGINRMSVIQIMRDLGYTVEVRDVARGELYMADEVFMTGTAAELTPIREIDNYAGRHRRARADHARRCSRVVRRRPVRARRALRTTGTTWSKCPARATTS